MMALPLLVIRGTKCFATINGPMVLTRKYCSRLFRQTSWSRFSGRRPSGLCKTPAQLISRSIGWAETETASATASRESSSVTSSRSSVTLCRCDSTSSCNAEAELGSRHVAIIFEDGNCPIRRLTNARPKPRLAPCTRATSGILNPRFQSTHRESSGGVPSECLHKVNPG